MSTSVYKEDRAKRKSLDSCNRDDILSAGSSYAKKCLFALQFALVLILLTTEEWPGWVDVWFIPRWLTCPQTVTDHSRYTTTGSDVNQYQLITSNALPQSRATNQYHISILQAGKRNGVNMLVLLLSQFLRPAISISRLRQCSHECRICRLIAIALSHQCMSLQF